MNQTFMTLLMLLNLLLFLYPQQPGATVPEQEATPLPQKTEGQKGERIEENLGTLIEKQLRELGK